MEEDIKQSKSLESVSFLPPNSIKSDEPNKVSLIDKLLTIFLILIGGFSKTHANN